MLSEVGGPIVDSLFTVRVEIAWFVPVLNPVVSHVPGLGSSWLHVIFYNSQSCSTVSLQESAVCRRLWVSHGDECVTLWDDLLAVDKESSTFYFSGRRDNVLDCLTHSMDRSIGNWFQGTVWWWMIAKKIVSSHPTPGLWLNKVCSVRINMQYHVACAILDCSVGYVAA